MLNNVIYVFLSTVYTAILQGCFYPQYLVDEESKTQKVK